MRTSLVILLAAVLAGCASHAPSVQSGQRQPPRRTLVSPDAVLASNYDDPAAPNQNYLVAAYAWHACVVKPVLPPDATSFSITSATMYFGKSTGQTGTSPWQVVIRPLDANGKPRADASQDIDRFTIPAASLPVLPSAQSPPPPVTATFTKAVNLDPTKGVAVILGPPGPTGVPLGYIACQTGGTQSPPDMSYYTGGTSVWTLVAPSAPGEPARDVLIEVGGTYTTP